ncbi:TetR/AcrR family transcriptional regulator [Leptolinea tardivitalis]|uniref:TetR/AcrR family transcriptional regulator n=1 Tax=Leptolinea tardivitalis TaxID=229920 RepID=UPI0009D719A8|nr:TetR/AcrR family transcriptional regulator [Leptolinea tardivitalis]GAP21433.1 transcriptional regulator, TetR family [Leptolinea tardivitalis]
MVTQKYHHGDLKNALIKAGIEILSSDGVGGLSLRKVAQRAGVSHSAPYAHFADKQALIAAISTEGYRRLYERLLSVNRNYSGDPLRQLVEAAWVYTRFALDDPAHFKITLSGIIEKEKDYPAFVEMSQRSFSVVAEIVRACQQEGILEPGDTDAVAVSVWSLVHGFVSLLLEGQISHTVTERMSTRELLIFTLNRMVEKPIPSEWVAEEGNI